MNVIPAENMTVVGIVMLNKEVTAHLLEDGVVAPDRIERQPHVTWLLLLNDDNSVAGVARVTTASPTIADFRVAFLPKYWRRKENVKLGLMAMEWCREHLPQTKLVAMIPVTAAPAIRYAQRLGFKREGICRHSFLKNGEYVDQVYLGT